MPPPVARVAQPTMLPRLRAPQTCRIFVMGESAAMGDPEPAYGFPRILQVLLQGRFPDRQFEVVNTAITAINSNVILPIARECAGDQGDIWVIYAGNNEVVGPFGAGTVFGAQPPSLALLRANLEIRRTRIGQLMETGMATLQRKPDTPQRWLGMEMFLGRQVRANEPSLAVVYQHWQRNLADILQAGIRRGVKIIVSTVVSNLKDCAPFGSLHSPALGSRTLQEWENIYGRAARLQTNGDYAAARTLLQQADQLDPDYAELHFRWGECAWSLGDYAEAGRQFQLARDLDTLRFRCDSHLNRIIRETTANRTNEGLYLLDAEELFARQSPHGITGDKFLYEHVHLNFDGNYLLARSVAEQVGQILLADNPTSPLPDWRSPEECAQRLALTSWDRLQALQALRERLRRPPFNHQLNYAERDRRLEKEIGQVQWTTQPTNLAHCVSVYRRALGQARGNWVLQRQFAKFLQALGDVAGAEQEWRQVIELVPQDAVAQYQLGRLLDRGHTRADAIRHFQQALRIVPYFPEAHNSMGIAWSHLQQYERAYREFGRALQIRPDFAEAHLNWGITLAAVGKLDEALAHYQSALRLQPESAEAHWRIGLLYGRLSRLPQAEAQLSEAVRLRPRWAVAHCDLGVALARQSKYEEAIAQFQETLRLEPTNQNAKAFLDNAQVHLNRPPQ